MKHQLLLNSISSSSSSSSFTSSLPILLLLLFSLQLSSSVSKMFVPKPSPSSSSLLDHLSIASLETSPPTPPPSSLSSLSSSSSELSRSTTNGMNLSKIILMNCSLKSSSKQPSSSSSSSSTPSISFVSLPTTVSSSSSSTSVSESIKIIRSKSCDGVDDDDDDDDGKEESNRETIDLKPLSNDSIRTKQNQLDSDIVVNETENNYRIKQFFIDNKLNYWINHPLLNEQENSLNPLKLFDSIHSSHHQHQHQHQQQQQQQQHHQKHHLFLHHHHHYYHKRNSLERSKNFDDNDWDHRKPQGFFLSTKAKILNDTNDWIEILRSKTRNKSSFEVDSIRKYRRTVRRIIPTSTSISTTTMATIYKNQSTQSLPERRASSSMITSASTAMSTIVLPNRVKKPLIEAHQHQIYSDVNAIEGHSTRLPCFVRTLGPSDSISLVLWYRGDDISGQPIFSLDARHQSFQNAQYFLHKSYQRKSSMNFTLNSNDSIESEEFEIKLPTTTTTTSSSSSSSVSVSSRRFENQKSDSIKSKQSLFSKENHSISDTIGSTLSMINEHRNENNQPISNVTSRFVTKTTTTTTTTTTSSTTIATSQATTLSNIKPIAKSTAHLFMMPVEENDSGLYWCRVDYKWERTTISTVNLNVIVPPKHLQLLLRTNQQSKKTKINPNQTPLPSSVPVLSTQSENISVIEKLNPNQTLILNEDDSVTLICLSEGGKPLPILNWYRNNELVRKQIFHVLTTKNQTLQSELHLTPIRIVDHRCWFKCLSSNDNHTFFSSQIQLLINAKPTKVEINAYPSRSKHFPLNSFSKTNDSFDSSNDREVKRKSWINNDEITFRCRSFGSRPPANHSWFLMPSGRSLTILEQNVIDPKSLKRINSFTLNVNTSDRDDEHQSYDTIYNDHHRNDNDDDDNDNDNIDRDDSTSITESMIRFLVQTENNGDRIVCRAQNYLLDKKSALEQSYLLDIQFAPKVVLQQIKIDSDRNDSKNLVGDKNEDEDIVLMNEINSKNRKITYSGNRIKQKDQNNQSKNAGYSRESLMKSSMNSKISSSSFSTSTSLSSFSGYVVRGDSLRLSCNIIANPHVKSSNIFWFKDSVPIVALPMGDETTTTTTSSSSFSYSSSIVMNIGTNQIESNQTDKMSSVDDNNHNGDHLDFFDVNDLDNLKSSWIRSSNSNLSELKHSNFRSKISFENNGTVMRINEIEEQSQGLYQCVAKNSLGTGISNHLRIQVLYEPSCVTPIQTIPANIGSVVTMVCEVRSNPWRNVQFRWRTKHRELALKSLQDDNASVPKMIDSRQKYSRIFSTLTSSPTRIVRNRLAIRIESSDDFGQYQCWAHNDVGEQREPCLYNIYENRQKNQLICSSNIAHDLIEVECQPNFDQKNFRSSIKINRTNHEIIDAEEYSIENADDDGDGDKDDDWSRKFSINFNLKIFNNKKDQLINLTSSEPKFLIHIDEIRMAQFRLTRTSLKDFDFDENFSMQISSQLDGRTISDVSLVFKVPRKSYPYSIVTETRSFSIANEKIYENNDTDFERKRSFNHSTIHHRSSNKNILIDKNLFDRSETDPIDGGENNLQLYRLQNQITATTSSLNTKTNAISFQRTTLNLHQLSLIWILMIILVVIFFALLFTIVLIKIRLDIRKRNDSRRQSKQNSLDSKSNSKVTASNTANTIKENSIEIRDDNDDGDDDIGSKSRCFEKKSIEVNDRMEFLDYETEIRPLQSDGFDSIKLFTLTNFDSNHVSMNIKNSDHQEISRETSLNYFTKHQTMDMLPDLMIDTLNASERYLMEPNESIRNDREIFRSEQMSLKERSKFQDLYLISNDTKIDGQDRSLDYKTIDRDSIRNLFPTSLHQPISQPNHRQNDLLQNLSHKDQDQFRTLSIQHPDIGVNNRVALMDTVEGPLIYSHSVQSDSSSSTNHMIEQQRSIENHSDYGATDNNSDPSANEMVLWRFIIDSDQLPH